MTSTVKADEHGQLEVVVHSMTRSCERSVMLELRPLEAGVQLPAFFAGSHIDLYSWTVRFCTGVSTSVFPCEFGCDKRSLHHCRS